MPDPLLYLKAMGTAAIVSATIVLAMAGMRRPAGTMRRNTACMLGIGLGLVVGYYELSLRLAWPPVNGLDRFLTIVVPSALGIELLAGFQRVPRWIAWFLRISLAAAIPRILLHGSVYLSGSGNDWTLWQAGTVMAVCGCLLAGLWSLLAWLSQRSPGISIPLALCLTIQCAGLNVMLAGYIKGGTAAFPLSATLAAAAIGVRLITKRCISPAHVDTAAILGIGVVGLFGIVFIGRFFGRLSTSFALVLVLAPLLCWVTEVPLLRHRNPWLVGLLRLVLVAIPLVVVLAVAKRDFDREMTPLLGMVQEDTDCPDLLHTCSCFTEAVPFKIRWPNHGESRQTISRSETRMFHRIRHSQLARQTPRRICVIKPSALGDVVQSLPLLPVLKTRFPAASISWVVNRELADLVNGHPCVDDVLVFDRRGGWSEWTRLLSELRSRRFDLVFDLQGLLRTGVMTLATRAPIRVGLQTAREGSSLTTNCIIPDSGRNVPAHARLWRVAEVLGLGDVPKETQIVVSNSDRDWVDAILRRLPRPVIAVHPGARWETKRWPVEKFASLLDRSSQAWNGSTIILGSGGERPDAERLEQRLAEGTAYAARSPVVNLAGQTTLKQLAALLARVDFAISNDSGPMHLAAGLGTPTLGLFTCTSATRSGPAGSQHELVSTMVACAASYCKRCPNHGEAHLACLLELDVERVWQSLQRLVAKSEFGRNRIERAA